MIAQLNRYITPLKRRLLSLIGKAIIVAVDDSTDLQTVKIELMKDEIIDKVERVQQFGFTSVPEEGTEAIVLSIGADRSNAIVIAVDDSNKRIKGLTKGEAAVYNSNGDFIKLHKDKIVISANNIFVGGESGAEPIVLGDALESYLSSFVDVFVTQWVITLPVPTLADIAALKTAILAWFATHPIPLYRSTKHKVN